MASESIRQVNLPIPIPGVMNKLDKEEDAMKCFEFPERKIKDIISADASPSGGASKRRKSIKRTSRLHEDKTPSSVIESPPSNRQRSHTIQKDHMGNGNKLDVSFSSEVM